MFGVAFAGPVRIGLLVRSKLAIWRHQYFPFNPIKLMADTVLFEPGKDSPGYLDCARLTGHFDRCS
jgi:hypothetical protein